MLGVVLIGRGTSVLIGNAILAEKITFKSKPGKSEVVAIQATERRAFQIERNTGAKD